MIDNKDVNLKLKFTDTPEITAKDIPISKIMQDIGFMNEAEILKILHKKNLVNQYNAFMKKDIDKMLELDDEDQLYWLKHWIKSTSKEYVKKCLNSGGYANLKTNEEVEEYFNYRLKLYNYALTKYMELVEYNYAMLNFSLNESSEILSNLGTGTKITANINKIIDIISTNPEIIKKYDRPWGYDFTVFGAGKVFCEKDDETVTVKKMLTMSFSWDVIIITHGTITKISEHLEKAEVDLIYKYYKLKDDNPKLPYNKLIDLLIPTLTKEEKTAFEKYNYKFSKLDNIYKRMYGKKGMLEWLFDSRRQQWGFWKPLLTPYGMFKSVNQCIKTCIDNGNKTIKLIVCNPGAFELPDEFKDLPDDIVVEYATVSVMIENAFTDFFKTGFTKISDAFKKIKDYLVSLKNNFKVFFNNVKKHSDDKLKRVKEDICCSGTFIGIDSNGNAYSLPYATTSKSDLVKQFDQCNNSIKTTVDKLN